MRAWSAELTVPSNAPRTVTLCGSSHNCSASLARLASAGKGSLPGAAVGLVTPVATRVHGPAHDGAVETVHRLLDGVIWWNWTAVCAGTDVTPTTENVEPEVTRTSLPALEVIATVTGVDASCHPLGSAPTVVCAPAAQRPVVGRQDLGGRQTPATRSRAHPTGPCRPPRRNRDR